jgi:AraC-like DNA-binding protein
MSKLEREDLEELFHYLPDVYYFKKNIDSQFVSGNQNFIHLCGAASIEEIYGKTDFDFFPKYMAEGYIRDDQYVLKTGEKVINRLEVNSNSKGVRWFMTTKVPLHDDAGNIIGLAGFGKDLKRAQHLLQPFDELQPALNYIEVHLCENIEIDVLAKITHLSLSQFERKFKNALQMTPSAYILKLKLDAASRALIESTYSISEIAHQYGFYDNSHFTRQFKRQFNLTPKEYRKEALRITY